MGFLRSKHNMVAVFLFATVLSLAITVVKPGTASAAIDYAASYAKMSSVLPDDGYWLSRTPQPNTTQINNINQCLAQNPVKWGCPTTDGYTYFNDSSANSHQYLTLGSRSINDDGHVPAGQAYKYANTIELAIYTRTPNSSKGVSISVVDRGIGDALACHNWITSYFYGGGSTQNFGGFPRQTYDCNGTSYSMDNYPGGVYNPGAGQYGPFKEIVDAQNRGTGIYKGRIVLSFGKDGDIGVNPSNSQISFHVSVSGGANIGYLAGSPPLDLSGNEQMNYDTGILPAAKPGEHGWTNVYPTNLAKDHKVRFFFRPLCTLAKNTKFFIAWDDVNEGQAQYQQTNAKATLYRFIPGNIGSRQVVIDSAGNPAVYNSLGPGYNQRKPVYVETYGVNDNLPYAYMVEFDGIDGGNGVSFRYPFDSGDARIECGDPNEGGSGGGTPVPPECDTFKYNLHEHSVYRFTAFYTRTDHDLTGPANNTFSGSMGGWRTYDGQEVFTSGNQTNGTDNDVPYSFNFPNPGENPNRKTYIERWHHVENNGGNDDWEYTWGVSEVGGCPFWHLTPSTTVSSVVVERGQNVGFINYLVNSGNVTAVDFQHGTQANYDPDAAAAGTGGFRNLDLLGGSIGAGATWSDSSYGLYVDPAIALGTKYCQQHWVSPHASVNGALITGFPAACTTVVGGLTSIKEIKADPKLIEQTQSVRFTSTITTRNFTNNPDDPSAWTGYDVSCNWSISVDGVTVPGKSGTCNQRISRDGDILVADQTYTTAANTPVGTKICLNVDISAANPYLLEDPKAAQDCTAVVVKPYLKAYGSDVSVGQAFGGTCNDSASIISWNKNSGLYPGAGGQFAVFARNTIIGFASAKSRLTSMNPTALSFTNTSTDPTNVATGGNFGGGFKGASCNITDYYGGKPAATKNWNGNVNSLNGSSTPDDSQPAFSATGNVDVKGGVLKKKDNPTVYIEGNIYIKDDITAETGSQTIADLPMFTIIVSGNIYIAPNVSQLYGTYIAQPNGAGGGNIYTCAKSDYTAYDPTAASTYDACNDSQLVVTGSFVAKKVHLLRTFGSLWQDTGDGKVPSGNGYGAAAEVFQYNPLIWIRESTTTDDKRGFVYSSITSLPPVL